MSSNNMRRNMGEIRSPVGIDLNALNWATEAPLRMLVNLSTPMSPNGRKNWLSMAGSDARPGWDCYETIVEQLKTLKDDETLLVQSGKPVGVFHTTQTRPASDR